MPFLRPTPFAFTMAIAALIVVPALAQEPDPPFVFTIATAERGVECELLTPWESAVILVATGRISQNLTEAEAAILAAAVADRAAEMACDDIGMNAWITSARPGTLREWLTPHLALFHALARMDPVPELFLTTAGVADLEGAIAAIDAQYAAFADAGIAAEGRRSWPEYQAIVDSIAPEIVAAATGAPNVIYRQTEATAFIVDTATIVALWLEDQD